VEGLFGELSGQPLPAWNLNDHHTNNDVMMMIVNVTPYTADVECVEALVCFVDVNINIYNNMRMLTDNL